MLKRTDAITKEFLEPITFFLASPLSFIQKNSRILGAQMQICLHKRVFLINVLLCYSVLWY